MNTLRLTIKDSQPLDHAAVELNTGLHPEISTLDPPVGESRDPVFYSIFIKEDYRHIGICCLYNLTNMGVEFGVRIFLPEYWGMGLGPEVVNALCGLAFGAHPEIPTVFAKTPVYNERAIRCYKKCGFMQYSRAMLSGYDMIYMMKSRR